MFVNCAKNCLKQSQKSLTFHSKHMHDSVYTAMTHSLMSRGIISIFLSSLTATLMTVDIRKSLGVCIITMATNIDLPDIAYRI